MQIPYKCKHYTKNENMNKTCKGEMMCKIYYEEECREYEEKDIMKKYKERDKIC